MASFKDIFREKLNPAKRQFQSYPSKICQTLDKQVCTLCPAVRVDYAEELKLKETTFREFWKSLDYPGTVEGIVSSPLARFYRTNSKRRLFIKQGRPYLGMTSVDEDGRVFPLSVRQCWIEPKAHSEIYALVQNELSQRPDGFFAKNLNYVIVRGESDACSVIFSISARIADANKELNDISKKLTRSVRTIISVFAIHDERSKYYLSSKAGRGKDAIRKIFGADELVEKAGDMIFHFSPFVFSQTNSSIITPMIKTVERLLKPASDHFLLDLYCGYGLFGLSMANKVKTVLGIESSKAAVANAISNARRQRIKNIRFLTEPITGRMLAKIPRSDSAKIAVIDPPRNGTDPGVIEFFQENRLKRVAHIFCEADLIKQELNRWKNAGYAPIQITPVDMFPATDHIETVVLLEPC